VTPKSDITRKRTTLADLEGRAVCSVEEAAEILEIGRSTAYAAARSGSLPSVRVSHRLLISVPGLRRLLELPE
jgi:excisionase family DNA binding protein